MRITMDIQIDMGMTEDLYNSKDVARVRALLLKEQQNKCAISGQDLSAVKAHTDHRHDNEHLVRGALNGNANMLLGKLENLQVRYLNHWYNGKLSDFLRQCADYLDKPVDRRWRHPSWQKKIVTEFNKLKVAQQNLLLHQLGQPHGSNLKERRKLLSKAILKREYGYITILNLIKNIKET